MSQDATIRYDGRDVTFLDCDPADCIEAGLLAGQWYEIDMLELIRDLDVEGNYLDVGAYVGTFTVYAGLFCPAKMVFSVEPQADIYEKLNRNIAANGLDRGGAFRAALGDRYRWGAMTKFPTNRGGSHVVDGQEIPVITLDGLRLPDVKLAKIDVEGGELAVLEGGLHTLANGVEHLFIEIWPEETCRRYDVPYTGAEVADFLHGLGFLHQRELPGDNHWWRKR